MAKKQSQNRNSEKLGIAYFFQNDGFFFEYEGKIQGAYNDLSEIKNYFKNVHEKDIEFFKK